VLGTPKLVGHSTSERVAVATGGDAAVAVEIDVELWVAAVRSPVGPPPQAMISNVSSPTTFHFAFIVAIANQGCEMVAT